MCVRMYRLMPALCQLDAWLAPHCSMCQHDQVHAPPKLCLSGLNMVVASDTPRLTGVPTGDSAPVLATPLPPPKIRVRSHWLPAARQAWLRPATCQRVAVRCAVRRARRHTCGARATVR